MKNYYKLVGIILLVYVVVLVLFVAFTAYDPSSTSVSADNVLLLNDISNKASDNWGNVDVYKDIVSNVDYVVLDNNNITVYDSRTKSSDPKDRITIENAIKNRYPYVYVEQDTKVLGAVILLDDGESVFNGLRLKITIGFAAAGLVIIAGALIYGLYVQKNIIVPFKNMERFAGKVAEGNLDEPLMIEKNNMFGSFSESFDIMREELSASRKRELELQMKERELVASLSHDLKTPVTGIKLTAELLKAKQEKSGQDHDIIEKLDNIYKKADEIDVLVTDLFSSTLEDIGEFKVALKDETSSVLGDIVSKHDDKGLTVSGDIPQVIINIDIKRMSQVIGNIIYNSYKYANTRIDVDYRLIDEYLEMRIRDHGPGVPEDEIELITNKFYRGKAQASAGSDGSGLGLYIARILMEKMNGELIPSNCDGGFVITLLIPLG